VKIIFLLGLNMSVYGYGNVYGMGYRYPRRKREVKTELDQEGKEKYAKAAIYNIGAARVNPWIAHLRSKGVYDEIRKLLNEAKKSYVPRPKNPEMRKKALQRELEILEEEYGALHENYPELIPTYTSKYGTTLSYENARRAADAKLRKRATDLMNMTGKVSQVIPPISPEELKALREQGIL
jgi:hypothetical protein